MVNIFITKIRESFIYLLFGLLVVLAFWSVWSQLQPVDASQYMTITIQKGDTLWQLANAYSEQHSLSVEKFIDWVQRVNNINPYVIHAGEELVIPVEK